MTASGAALQMDARQFLCLGKSAKGRKMMRLTLPRTGLPDLEFLGQLLAESVGSDADGATQGRTHSVAIFETDDHEFVVAVSFDSPFEEELSDNIAESVRTPEEVEAFLSLYDATERVNRKRLREGLTEKKMQALFETLQQRFDQQVLKVLHVFHHRQPV